LSDADWPIKIATLRNRTLSSVVERFIACAKDVVQSTTERPRRRQRPS
jgi:hypothetical protein